MGKSRTQHEEESKILAEISILKAELESISLRIDELEKRIESIHSGIAHHSTSKINFISTFVSKNGASRHQTISMWRAMLTTLQVTIFQGRRSEFDQYLRPLKVKHFDGQNIVIIAPNSICAEWITENALEAMNNALFEINHTKISISLLVDDGTSGVWKS
ncbi:MAG: DnaA N-terminal domain-containing protein [Anaerolineaceae bacterium]